MGELNSTVVSPNISSCPGPTPAVTLDPTTISAVAVMSLCFLLGTPGNIAVIILRPNWQHLSNVTQLLMLNLAVSDVLSLLTLPLWIYAFLFGWIFGLVACKILTYFIYCSLYSSLLTVTMLSVQRYLQMVYLMRCLQEHRFKLLALSWLVAMTLSVSVLLNRQVITEENETFCQSSYSKPKRIAQLMTESMVGLLSFFVLLFSYICLYRRVNQGVFFNHQHTARLLSSIVLTFLVLWIPHHIINFLAVAALSTNSHRLLEFCTYSRKIIDVLPFVNSCLNPLLYAFSSCDICTQCAQRTEN